jgi:hypothetical protein
LGRQNNERTKIKKHRERGGGGAGRKNERGTTGQKEGQGEKQGQERGRGAGKRGKGMV